MSSQLSAMLAEMVRAHEVQLPAPWCPEVKPGETVGRFRIVRELGRGGFGVVYEAVDEELSRTVALKLVRPGARIAARGGQQMLREAEAVARLNHPHIITLHDLGQGPNGPYLVFELLRGSTLWERLRGGPLPLDQAIDVGLAVSRALVHAHSAGVLHRDLTAANVHLGADGVVKVLDFGLAHLFGREGAGDGGTPAYMAPEQWEGGSGDARADLFALGVILFQALAGRLPYKADRGWSEALEPGETPRLPWRAAPRRLRRLVEALIDREPGRRPADAKAVRDALLALRRARDGAGRQRVLWGLGAVAAAALALSGGLYLHREPAPGEQVHAVMAAMENGAGEPTLDAVPGLLAAALEPSQRVKLLPASRLAYASRQAGLGEPGRIDAERGRTLARLAGAEVVLAPFSWREDARPVVGVRAIQSEDGRALFTASVVVKEHAALAAAVDRLSDRIRRELKERADDRKLRRPVAEAVTASAEAARAYYDGVDCLRKRAYMSGNALQCTGQFEQALSLDPTFPLANYQLAAMNFIRGDSGAQARPFLERALRSAVRLPARERRLLEALSFRVEGRGEEARGIYEELLAAAPEDPELLAKASDLLASRGEWDAALRYLVKWTAVAPDEEQAHMLLIEALGRLNRVEELQALVETLSSRAPCPWAVLVEALVWLGDADRAVERARAAVEREGEKQLATLCHALRARGDFMELERQARRLLERRSTLARGQEFVEVALVGQGRVEDALRWADEVGEQLPRSAQANSMYRRALDAAAWWEPARMWPYAARTFALDPRLAADLAIALVLIGDREHADTLAARLTPGSYQEGEYRALVEWRSGDAASAMSRLARLEQQDAWPVDGIAPAYLLAEISADQRDDVTTLSAIARFKRLPPDRVWRSWAHGRVLFLAARAHARLGDRNRARGELDLLLRTLSHAPQELPLLRQAQSLRSRI